LPEFGGRRESVEWEFACSMAAVLAGAIVLEEGVAVAEL
jgi:hypothetical protein